MNADLNFEDNGSKQEFHDKTESMKCKLVPGKTLDNRQFILLEKAESHESIQEPTGATVDDQQEQSCTVKSSMLDSSGM